MSALDRAEMLDAVPPAVVVEAPEESFRTYYTLDDYFTPTMWVCADDGERLAAQELLNYLGDRPWRLLR